MADEEPAQPNTEPGVFVVRKWLVVYAAGLIAATATAVFGYVELRGARHYYDELDKRYTQRVHVERALRCAENIVEATNDNISTFVHLMKEHSTGMELVLTRLISEDFEVFHHYHSYRKIYSNNPRDFLIEIRNSKKSVSMIPKDILVTIVDIAESEKKLVEAADKVSSHEVNFSGCISIVS